MNKVEHWKSKVDRSIIEKIKAFQNPPTIIGQILEVLIHLIGKKKVLGQQSDTASSHNEASSKDDKSSHAPENSSNSKPKISMISGEKIKE